MRQPIATRAFHGAAKLKLPEYRSWKHMRSRCNSPTDKNYANYGGRGIKVCERWNRFENFFADMGQKPSKGHSIDRIENEGDYSPDNCRWARSLEQNNNRRDNHRVQTPWGVLSMEEAAKKLGMKYATLRFRLIEGKEIKKSMAAAGVSLLA